MRLAQGHPGRPDLRLQERGQGQHEDPYPHGRCRRSEDQLHLRQRRPLLLRQGGKGDTLNYSWQYCFDQAGNLTSQGTGKGCPNAQQITAKNGDSTNWAYDAAGNETAGASTPKGTRTREQWSDCSQLTSVTVGGKTYEGQYGSTDQSERIRLGDTVFHNGPLGLSAKSTGGVDMGCNREPGGTLNSMTTGGKSYYYLTDALGSVIALTDESGAKVNTYSYSPRSVERVASSEKVSQPYRFAGGYQDTGLYHFAAHYYYPHMTRFTQPDPSGQEKNPYLYAEGDPVNRIEPTGLFSFSDVLDIGEKVVTGVSGCLAGIGAAGESGVLTAATGFFGTPGTIAAGTFSCAVGAGAAYMNADIMSYG